MRSEWPMAGNTAKRHRPRNLVKQLVPEWCFRATMCSAVNGPGCTTIGNPGFTPSLVLIIAYGRVHRSAEPNPIKISTLHITVTETHGAITLVITEQGTP